jgi:hypothetical protein
VKVHAHVKNRILTVKLLGGWRFCSVHYQILLQLQHEVPNLPLEIEPNQPGVRQFICVHQLDLERYQTLTLLNAAA